MDRAKAAERASFLLPRESPSPSRPKTTQAAGMAIFFWYSTSYGPHSMRPLPAPFRARTRVFSSLIVISRSPLARGMVGNSSSKGSGK